MIFVSIIFFFLTASPNCGISGAEATLLSNVSDQQALLHFKASITGDPVVLSSWNHSIHFCQWEGVTCSSRRQRVTALNLSSHRLGGTLSPHIGNLSFLRAIYLDINNFRGTIPGEIGQLARLRYLHLGTNSFEGGFPMNLSHCLDIIDISIEENNLQGKLPTEFTSWSKLTLFVANTNHFTGSIPPSIGNMSSLRVLDIAKNNLTGSIPLEVAHLLRLESLRLSINNLLGMVPPLLYNISSLSSVKLSLNKLEGRLPADLGLTLPNLQVFAVGANTFSGSFPPSIANASKLVIFEIVENYIRGPLPMSFGSLLSLERLNLGDNQLGYSQHPGGLSFIGSLINSTGLRHLGLNENGFSGELPNSIANLTTTLAYVDFYQNYIYGSIPQEIGKLFNIEVLLLDKNSVKGSIPKSICKLSNLGRLLLGDNNISGVIPTCISNLTIVLILDLGRNHLHGSIPTALLNVSSLEGLSLDHNQLSGEIPNNIMGLSSISQGLYLQQNILTGPLPSNIGSLTQLVELDLSDNKLTGEIPASLGDCIMLEKLYMGGNFFEGTIPSSLRRLKSIKYLILSNNNISGNIPQFFGEFRLLQFLNLSHNKLGGEVPKKGLFLNASAFSIVGNFQLCGGIQALQLPACSANISKTKKKKLSVRIVLLLAILPLATLLACLSIVFFRIKRSKQKSVRSLVLQEKQNPRLSYQDLLRATNEFSQNNLLGEGRYGSVYKGILESVQQIFAVKVLNVEVHGANKNFLAECEILRSIRHRNLIRIITACSSTDFKGNDFKALVFEFMTNGSLENWLHPSPSDTGNERYLTLFQRVNIAIDIALALDYLHHHCHAEIIHCDIKPSNILLDEKFVARVSDFGLARIFFTSTCDVSQAQNSSTGVRGTIGYVPPEYGMGGNISAKGDVYSYGILLLELFSGQRPTSSSILMNPANNLHDYVRKALPYKVMEIVDPHIVLQQDDYGSIRDESGGQSSISNRMEICLASIFEVGVLCSVERPGERLDISVAVKQLQIARDKFSGTLQ